MKNLTERAMDTTTSEIYNIISEYVTYGEWKSADQFDHIFFRLMGLLPRPKWGMSLFRVIRLTDDQMSEYNAGTLILHNRKFSSWTRSIDVATKMAQTKGDNCIIVSEHFKPEQIIVDVADFYEANELTRTQEWNRYVRNELEVIVYDNSERPIDGFNSYLFKNRLPPAEPMIGDAVFYHSDDDDGSLIDDVDHDQPFGHRGIFSVTLEDGDTYYVRSLGGHQWEVVEEVNEEVASEYTASARDRAFTELAKGQRGDPELAMLRVQAANVGGLLSYLVEHVGDLTHRMAQYPEKSDYYCGFELVEPKVRRSLRMLESAYGFEREIAENNVANSRYKNITVEQFESRLNKTLDAYATEHRKLRVYNRAQWCAREAAIALGERKWQKATKCLRELSQHLGDRDEWVSFASPYVEDFDNGSSLI